MEELKSAMNEHMDLMADLVERFTAELRSGLQPASENFIGFFHAIDWKDSHDEVPKSVGDSVEVDEENDGENASLEVLASESSDSVAGESEGEISSRPQSKHDPRRENFVHDTSASLAEHMKTSEHKEDSPLMDNPSLGCPFEGFDLNTQANPEQAESILLEQAHTSGAGAARITRESVFSEIVEGAVQSKEPWLMCLMLFHVVLLLVTFMSRKNINFQMFLFLLALGGVYLAERLNSFLGDNWKSFAGQNYFDRHGVFLSVLWSGPLLVISIIILVNTLFSLCQLIIRWKRAELRHRARLSHTKEE